MAEHEGPDGGTRNAVIVQVEITEPEQLAVPHAIWDALGLQLGDRVAAGR